MSGLLLHDALQASYMSTGQSGEFMKDKGYLLDPELSNIEEKVFYNPSNSDLLITYRGSQNLLNDWLDTNVKIGQGKFKESDRYKRSKDVYEKAKQKYNKDSVKLVGHSMGGLAASSVGSDNDLIYTYNKAPSGFNKKNEKHFRTKGDTVSLLNKFDKNTINLSNKKLIKNSLTSHSLDNLKNKNIFI
jgi:hypothetical protein